MEVSALKYSGGIGLHARSPLLRLQSDERLVALVRRGSASAFEILVSRYESRLLAFCRHLLGSREDAEDVLQEVFAAAFNAMNADDRPINVRPWLYRIARNRSLNHLRRAQAVGVDSMDIHFSENGTTAADKVHEREEFRLLVGDIHELPETQKTALVLREMDALSYGQIAEAMETTVPSVKSLLVRARVSLAEAAEARLLSCDEVRIELGEVAEGLRRRPNPLVRRHLRVCQRCSAFKVQLKQNNRALAAIMPLGPLVLLKKFALAHLGHSAGSSATSAGASASGAGGAAAAGSTLVTGSTAGGFVSAGMGAIATKAAAGLAAAALVTGAAVEVDHSSRTHSHTHVAALPVITHAAPATHATSTWSTATHTAGGLGTKQVADSHHKVPSAHKPLLIASTAVKATAATAATAATKKATTTSTSTTTTSSSTATTPSPPPGRTQTQSDPTILSPSQADGTTASTPTSTSTTTPPPPTALAPVTGSQPPSTTTTTTTTTTTSTTTAPPSDPGQGAAPPANTGDPSSDPTAPGTSDPSAP